MLLPSIPTLSGSFRHMLKYLFSTAPSRVNETLLPSIRIAFQVSDLCENMLLELEVVAAIGEAYTRANGKWPPVKVR